MDRRKFLQSTGLAGMGLTSSFDMGVKPRVNPVLVNIMDFGATGAGEDVSANIEAAIASMDVYGGVLWFPPGVYGLGRPIANTNKGVSFQGAGKFSSFFRVLFANGNVFTPQYSGVSFRNISFETLLQRTGGDYVFWHQDAVEGLMDNVRMTGQWGGVNIDSGATVILSNMMIRNGIAGQGYAVRVGRGNDHKLFQITSDNPSGQTAAGLLVEGAASLQVTDCDFIRGGKAVHIKEAYSALFENTFFDSSVVGAYLEGSKPIVRCKFSNCGISSHSDRGIVVLQSTGGIVDDIGIRGCTIDFNGRDGVFLDKGNNIDLSHNTIAGNGGAGVLVGSGVNKNDFSVFRNRIGGTSGAVANNAVGLWNLGGGNIGEAFHFNNFKGNNTVKGGNTTSLPTDNIV